jgi:hypothetical protein
VIIYLDNDKSSMKKKGKKNGTTEDTEGTLMKKLCELFIFLNQKVLSLKRIHSENKKVEISA